jgi:hypothetical protein
MLRAPSIYFLDRDIRKAAKAEAWMLTFLGICVALDVMAQEYYFNTAYRRDPQNEVKEEFKQLSENASSKHFEWDHEKWEKFKSRPGNSGKIFRHFLTDLAKMDRGDAELLWIFRCKMAHDFSPAELSISHYPNPNKGYLFSVRTAQYDEDDIMKFLAKAGAKVTLYLPNFYWFYRDVFNNPRSTVDPTDWVPIMNYLIVNPGSKEFWKDQPFRVEDVIEARREPFEREERES